ncbi:hypothetical protein AOLI_G00059780 [Acnodon oligacanthus]
MPEKHNGCSSIPSSAYFPMRLLSGCNGSGAGQGEAVEEVLYAVGRHPVPAFGLAAGEEVTCTEETELFWQEGCPQPADETVRAEAAKAQWTTVTSSIVKPMLKLCICCT